MSPFTELALWNAARLARLDSRMLIARTPFFRKLLDRLRGPADPSPAAATPRVPRPTPEESLPMLADAVVGCTKSTLASVFGPPRGAVLGNAPAGDSETFWDASIWYYPLPRNGRLAMAITFDQDVARQVDFFQFPAAQAA